MAQYLVKKFSDIFGKLKITPSRDLLWFDAIQKAKDDKRAINGYYR